MIVNLANLSRSCFAPDVFKFDGYFAVVSRIFYGCNGSVSEAGMADECSYFYLPGSGRDCGLCRRMGFTCGFRVYLGQPFARRRSANGSRCRCGDPYLLQFHREVLRGLSASNGNRFHDMVSLGDSCLVCTGISTYRESRSLMNRLGGEETVCPLR